MLRRDSHRVSTTRIPFFVFPSKILNAVSQFLRSWRGRVSTVANIFWVAMCFSERRSLAIASSERCGTLLHVCDSSNAAHQQREGECALLRWRVFLCDEDEYTRVCKENSRYTVTFSRRGENFCRRAWCKARGMIYSVVHVQSEGNV